MVRASRTHTLTHTHTHTHTHTLTLTLTLTLTRYEQDELAVGSPLYAWLPAPVAISPKLVFCFCAAPYTEDELWPKVVVFANWAKWCACAMAQP